MARYSLLGVQQVGRVCSSAAKCRQGKCFINPLVETSRRYKHLAWQKVSFTSAFQSHRHPPEMVSPTHLETIYSLVLENLGDVERRGGVGWLLFSCSYTLLSSRPFLCALNIWVAHVAGFLWFLLPVPEFPNILVLIINPWPVLSYLLFICNPEDLLEGFQEIVAAYRILLHVTNMVIRGLVGRVMEEGWWRRSDGGGVMEEGSWGM